MKRRTSPIESVTITLKDLTSEQWEAVFRVFREHHADLDHYLCQVIIAIGLRLIEEDKEGERTP